MRRSLRRIAGPVAAAFVLATALTACASPGDGAARPGGGAAGPVSSGAPAISPAGSGSGATGGSGVLTPSITVGPPQPTAGPTPPATSRPPTAARSLVTGVVDAEPGCPGPVTDPPCPARPVAGAVVAVSGPVGTATWAVTDKAGRFSFRLAPGTYRFTANNPGGLHSTVSKLVHVPIATPLELTVDSGMR